MVNELPPVFQPAVLALYLYRFLPQVPVPSQYGQVRYRLLPGAAGGCHPLSIGAHLGLSLPVP